ncbi:AAA family ATPase [Lacinutrix algicola]|uniref:AAA family ATPase n=1 Tax=Lacinutrix algicola TaxID=342954 RepID=UPI0006E1FA2C|nr:AAA family ATPase [Lacinutrix algicola]
MRLAAIYLDFHDYLFEEEQKINLGGKFIYDFIKDGEEIIVSRKVNTSYIDGFFDVTKLDSKLLNVNAIVGQNGAGKSSVLDSLRSLFIQNPSALPSNNTYLFFETDNEKELRFVSSIYEVGNKSSLKFISNSNEFTIDYERTNSNYQTIYYSPHFDFKYNPDFDNIDDFDISFDKILQEDLNDLENKEASQSGTNYSAAQELLFKNAIRQILFLSSDVVNKDKIFQDLFDFPDLGEARLVIRGHKRDQELNIPVSFRTGLRSIKDKLQNELDDWGNVREYKSHGRVSNQIDVNKYILKRYTLRALVSLFERQMEKNNSYLSAGKFEYESFERESNGLDAYESLLNFVSNSFLSFGSDKVKVFKDEIIKSLLDKIYVSIDSIKVVRKVKNDVLVIDSVSAIEILKLQREFLIDIINYYSFYKEKPQKNIIPKNNLIDGFINYMPSNKKLSSGENALLNLFSRIHDFLTTKLSLETQVYKEAENYILLLDEADLGFHPVWKRKFVNTIIKTIPYFFNELDRNPNVQIIFTTHDPLTLSDLPNKNIVYLLRNSERNETEFLEYENPSRPKKSFAANITDLLADSFFVEDGLLGDFAKEKIQDTIIWLRDEKRDVSEVEYHKSLINIIDEPIVKRKLSEMFDSIFNTDFEIQTIEEQIIELQKLKSKLKK